MSRSSRGIRRGLPVNVITQASTWPRVSRISAQKMDCSAAIRAPLSDMHLVCTSTRSSTRAGRKYSMSILRSVQAVGSGSSRPGNLVMPHREKTPNGRAPCSANNSHDRRRPKDPCLRNRCEWARYALALKMAGARELIVALVREKADLRRIARRRWQPQMGKSVAGQNAPARRALHKALLQQRTVRQFLRWRRAPRRAPRRWFRCRPVRRRNFPRSIAR